MNSRVAVPELRELAERVRAQGFSCAIEDGHSYTVRNGNGTRLATFSAHARPAYLAAKRAESDLRNAGILPRHRNEEARKTKKSKRRKENGMAATGQQDKADAKNLAVRLKARLKEMGGDSPQNRTLLAEQAVGVIEARRRSGDLDVEQFGSTGAGKSAPRDIARESLRNLIDKGVGATKKSLARWDAVLEAERHAEVPDNGSGPAKEAARQAMEETAGDAVAALKDMRERLELAESVLEDAERERDEVKRQRDDVTERLDAQERRAATSEKEVEDLRVANRELQEQLESAEARTTATLETGERALTGGETLRLEMAREFIHAAAEMADPPEWMLERIDRIAGI